MQYTTTGSLSWIRQFGVASNSVHAVAADPQGNAYVTGETSSSTYVSYYPGVQDAFIAKYNSQGDPVWYRQIGSLAQEIGEDIAVDGVGNIYLAGAANASVKAKRSTAISTGF